MYRKLDNFVGVEDGKLPQMISLLKDGRWGELPIVDPKEFLDDINAKISKIGKDFSDIKIPSLKLQEGVSLQQTTS